MKINTKSWFTLVLLVLTFALGAVVALADDDDSKGKEETVTMADLPQPVKTTVLKESEGFTVAELQKLTTEDGTFFEAEWIDGELEISILMAPDGKILQRESEKADDDDEDADSGDADDD